MKVPRFENHQGIWPSADGSNPFLVQLISTASPVRSYEDLAKQIESSGRRTRPRRVTQSMTSVVSPSASTKRRWSRYFTGSTLVQVVTFGNKELQALELAKPALARVE